MILIGFAACFGYLMTMMQIPMKVTAFLTGLSDNPYVILLLINLLLLVLGTLMDMAPLILILTPILLPVVKTLGVDPVHFGMIMMVNLGIGLITPPDGSVLFVAAAFALGLFLGALVSVARDYYDEQAAQDAERDQAMTRLSGEAEKLGDLIVSRLLAAS